MLFTTNPLVSLILTLGTLSRVAHAAPAVQARDVYAPPVTYPHEGTLWYTGQRHNVTWDVSSPPVNITNTISEVILRNSDLTIFISLAKGFKITSGRHEVTVPSVESRDDYMILLMGDSGNVSPKFTILERNL